ncbi:uncharacterized protein LOC141724157 isoform X2 [Apium graveolens]|uniref:uncharacterized protein LOC141724157 isoform X2 n=1 Tax=Apium graveolens TaxID=4045 RepID=UPI003D7AE3F1
MDPNSLHYSNLLLCTKMSTNREDSSVRRETRRQKLLKLRKTSYRDPLEVDEESAEQPNIVTNRRDTRSVHFDDDDDDDDDDDIVTPRPKTNRTAPILLCSSTAEKWRLIAENVRQEEEPKNEGKKLMIKHQKTKLRLVDEESDEDQLGVVNDKERRKKKIKITKEPYQEKRKGKVGKAGKVNVTDKFRIRNSPNTLTDMVTNLSEQQKQWVRTTGFRHLLDFRLEKIPHRLACSVLEAFDAQNCLLKLQSENVAITNQDVYNVLGLPIGDTLFTLATENKSLERHYTWKEQFGKNNITTAAVTERIKESEEADDLFKLNFLIVLSNVLIERQTGSYVHRDILGFDIQLDQCNQYNWGEFLLRCLVRTKANWRKATSSLFYTGPIIFLTIFYVDRVILKGLKPVERQLPAFRNWTMELLKQRQNYEKQCEDFEKCLVIRQRAEIDQNGHGVEENNTDREDDRNQAGQCSHYLENSERMVMDKDSLPISWMEISMKTANKGAASQAAQPIVAKEMKRKLEPFVDTDEEDIQPLSLGKACASTVAKPAACSASSSLTAGAAATEAGVTESGDKRKLLENSTVPKYTNNMLTEGTIARQAQKQMCQAALSVSELCTGFVTAKMKNEELRKQVTDLEVHIQKLKRHKASWNVKKKELERERDEGWEKALKAVGEKRNLELKLEEAVRRAEDAKASTKAIHEAALRAVSEKQNLEEKLEKAVKQAEDAKASAKKKIHEAVASTKKRYKTGLEKFLAHLANGEGISLVDYVNEFGKEISCHYAPS